MSDIVNLRQVRKEKARHAKEVVAEASNIAIYININASAIS